MSSKHFPQDCKGCKYYITYDMSVDDWTNICTYMHVQVDDCDSDFGWCECTLPESLKEKNKDAR